MAYQYGAPSDTQLRPRCWGDDRFHNMSTRECRNCTYNMSCRDEIYRLHGYRQTAPNVAPPPYNSPGYYPGYQVQPPTSTQVPVHIGAPQPAQARPPPQSLVQAYPPPQRYQFGWLTDPLYYSMVASPPPMRPQLPGENFIERVFKNMLLSAGEAFFMHGFLAMRQLVLPPEELPARGQEVDVPQPVPNIPGNGNT